MRTVHAADALDPFRNRVETVDSVGPPRGHEEPEVPFAVLPEMPGAGRSRVKAARFQRLL
jgi:hypothetical protein